jgi:antitoxin YefM
MTAINVTRFRETLKESLEEVVANHEPLIVTRPNGQNVVVLSYEDFAAVEETSYLLRSPANAKRLKESLESYERGLGIERSLVDMVAEG